MKSPRLYNYNEQERAAVVSQAQTPLTRFFCEFAVQLVNACRYIKFMHVAYTDNRLPKEKDRKSTIKTSEMKAIYISATGCDRPHNYLLK
jgi:hypothetical protein